MRRLDFGDLRQLGQSIAVAVRRRNLGVISTTWWVIRENYRRGTHQRFTFADYRAMRHRRRPR